MGVAIEELIIEAQKAGKFDNLPGRGRPQQLDSSPDAVVNGLLKEANYTPEWAALAREIDALLVAAEKLWEEYALCHARELAAIMEAAHEIPAAPKRSFWAGWRLESHAPEQKRDRLAAFNREWEMTLARYTLHLQQAEAKIRRYNSIVPFARQQRKVPEVRGLREQFAARFPRLRRTEAGIEVVQGTPPRLMPLQSRRDIMTATEHNYYRLGRLRRAGRRCSERRYDETYGVMLP